MNDHLNTIALSQKERMVVKGYQLIGQSGMVLKEHEAPSYLNWYKKRYGIKGVIKGVY